MGAEAPEHEDLETPFKNLVDGTQLYFLVVWLWDHADQCIHGQQVSYNFNKRVVLRIE